MLGGFQKSEKQSLRKPFEIVKGILEYRRLKEIKRCNNYRVLKGEDVAQHSFYTAFLAKVISEDYNHFAREYNLQFHPFDSDNNLEEFNVRKVVEMALFHDIEEAFTSDIPYHVKHSGDGSSASLSASLNKIFERNQPEYFIFEDLVNIQKSSKEGFEGSLVAICDLLELAIYCCDEIVYGNFSLNPIREECVEIIKASPIYSLLEANSAVFREIMTVIMYGYKNLRKVYKELKIK